MSNPLSRILDVRLTQDPASPLVTYYDDSTGERVELSAATFANWVAKTCGLLDSRGVRENDLVGFWLPAHWQSAAILAACWRIGARVTLEPENVSVALAHEPRVDEALDLADEVLGLALAPMAGRMREIPLGAEDYTVEVPVFADSWLGPHPSAVEAALVPDLAGERILTTATTWTEPLIDGLLVTPIASGGSVVLVHNADATRLERIAAQEATTASR